MITVNKTNQTMVATDEAKSSKVCPKAPNSVCPKCQKELQSSYGLGSGYGYGSYDVCLSCWLVFNFVEDTGE